MEAENKYMKIENKTEKYKRKYLVRAGLRRPKGRSCQFQGRINHVIGSFMKE